MNAQDKNEMCERFKIYFEERKAAVTVRPSKSTNIFREIRSEICRSEDREALKEMKTVRTAE